MTSYQHINLIKKKLWTKHHPREVSDVRLNMKFLKHDGASIYYSYLCFITMVRNHDLILIHPMKLGFRHHTDHILFQLKQKLRYE